jgi:spore coat-associated protein N
VLRLLAILALAGCFCGAAAGTLLAHTLRSQDAQAKVAPVMIKFGKRNRFSVGAAGLVPGDSVQRIFNLKNVGSIQIHAVSLTTVAAPSSPLDSDPVNGLQLQIDKCTKTWKIPKGSTKYACTGQAAQVVAPRPVIGSGIALANVSEMDRPGQMVRLLLTLTLPATATSVVMGQTSGITYTFTAA